MKNCSLSTVAGTATSKKPTIISSYVWPPQVTVLLGSGLCGFSSELSYGNRLQPGSSFQEQRLCQPIAELPMEVIVDAQQRLDGPVGVQDVVFEPLAPQMHVGE